ncbi:MAG: hypothetical protein JW820_19015 [Spirochaetales bacterium]|nr:hypothetical protein [Spirochaetales bacterium]
MAASLALMAAAAGCGLELYPDLLNPPADPLFGADYFQFEATAANGVVTVDYPDEQYFQGFEVYYKIYDPADSSLITADQEAIAVFEDLQIRGFRRIHKTSDRTLAVDKPLVYVHPDDRGELFTVKVSFQTTDYPYPLIDVEAIAPSVLLHEADMEPQDLRRAVNYTSPADPTRFKRFDDFLEVIDSNDVVDADIAYNPAIWAKISTDDQVTLVLYALSHGFIPDQAREFYSQPVRLGQIDTITFPANDTES